MRRLISPVLVLSGCTLAWTSVAVAQFGRGSDWTTSGNDAQRSSWFKTDAKISKASMETPGFQFLWKLKLSNDPRQLNSLTSAVLLDRYIGYKGFRSFAFVGGSSDKVFAIDSDLARLEWQKQLAPASPQQNHSLDCPGGLTSALTRPTVAAMAAAPAGRGGVVSGAAVLRAVESVKLCRARSFWRRLKQLVVQVVRADPEHRVVRACPPHRVVLADPQHQALRPHPVLPAPRPAEASVLAVEAPLPPTPCRATGCCTRST